LEASEIVADSCPRQLLVRRLCPRARHAWCVAGPAPGRRPSTGLAADGT